MGMPLETFARDNHPIPTIGSYRRRLTTVAIHCVKPKVAAEALADDIHIAHERLLDLGEPPLAAVRALISFGNLAAPGHSIPRAEGRYVHQ
ncbi:hypothetical protein BCCH1_79400 (plasmid) [Burkholderia contaminans]|jgi:hypothetical protein|uniref:Uncharacterized protein n=1 Tax=Burkholderia contaminans TaxID=488447 RepID=A0A250LNU6_9BURK|nr:hypothetical protein BCCH1_79400 [Burkholderia contaminans]